MQKSENRPFFRRRNFCIADLIFYTNSTKNIFKLLLNRWRHYFSSNLLLKSLNLLFLWEAVACKMAVAGSKSVRFYKEERPGRQSWLGGCACAKVILVSNFRRRWKGKGFLWFEEFFHIHPQEKRKENRFLNPVIYWFLRETDRKSLYRCLKWFFSHMRKPPRLFCEVIVDWKPTICHNFTLNLFF